MSDWDKLLLDTSPTASDIKDAVACAFAQNPRSVNVETSKNHKKI